MHKYHYTYLITCTRPIDDRWLYIGVRSCDCDPKDDVYLGSCDSMNLVIKEQGKQYFYKQVLEIFSTRDAAVSHEISLHNAFDVALCGEFFNKAKQTSIGFSAVGNPSQKGTKREKQPIIYCPHCEEKGGATGMKRWHFDNCPIINTQAQLIAQGRYPTPETISKMSMSAIGRIILPETIAKRKISMGVYKPTPETISKISIANTGKTRTTEEKTKMSEAAYRRRKPTEEENRRRSERMIGVKQGQRKKNLVDILDKNTDIELQT